MPQSGGTDAVKGKSKGEGKSPFDKSVVLPHLHNISQAKPPQLHPHNNFNDSTNGHKKAK